MRIPMLGRPAAITPIPPVTETMNGEGPCLPHLDTTSQPSEISADASAFSQDVSRPWQQQQRRGLERSRCGRTQRGIVFRPGHSARAAERPTMQDKQLTRLVLQLLRPYRGWLLIVFAAMLVEISMSLAAPWPLKLVLDDALGHHKLPELLAWAHNYGIERNTLGVALFAGLCNSADCGHRRRGDLHRQLLHHERRAVGGQRPPHSHLRAPSPAFASVLR